MTKGRSVYTIQFNCNPIAVNNTIQKYLQGNRFTLKSKDGEQFYKASDGIESSWYFSYTIMGQTLTIYAWFRNLISDIQIDNIPAAVNYRNTLSKLFQEIQRLNTYNVNYDPNTGQLINQNHNQVYQTDNAFAEQFENEIMKKQEKLCEIGFWLSIGGIFLALIGFFYGIFIQFAIFYFASLGLKTKKKNKAIVTIIIAICTIVYIITTGNN